MLADAAWLERGGLRSALAQAAQGVPLLVLGGNADDAALWQRELGLRLAALSATTEQEDVRHLALPGATLAFAPGAQLPVAAGGAAWQISSYGLQREVPDWIRGRVFSADYGFVTLTMSLSSLFAGVAADRFGAVPATIGTASLALVFAVVWGALTWRLWRPGMLKSRANDPPRV